ncbi:hypothetical protein GCM10020331_093900 [Ectobacillus funiculus]
MSLFLLRRKTKRTNHKKILEVEAIRLVDIAVQRNTPLVLEVLDTTLSKSAGRYRNRKQKPKDEHVCL